MRVRAPLLLATLVVAFTLLPQQDAAGMPAFARRYNLSCVQCHAPFPRLAGLGDSFAAHGFRLAPGEAPVDTIPTGDDLLVLGKDLPLAIRADLHARWDGGPDAGTSFDTPYGLKILSSAPLSSALSYYFYFFLAERGEVGGIEDAFVMWNDVGGAALDLSVGQFQVSDPLFKRELRLEYDDYVAYRMRIGAAPTDLAYDRGITAAWDVAGFTLSAAVVNGNGKGEAQPNLRLDDDPLKNLFGHASFDLLPGVLRLGALGYWGHQDAAVEDGPEVRDEMWMAGGDATLTVGAFELNAQYLHREDDTPTFTPGEPAVTVDGGFAELLYLPGGSRWYGFALYNLLDADRPLLNPRMGTGENLDRYETMSGGLGWLARRNVRVQGEGQYDFELERGRFIASLILAY